MSGLWRRRTVRHLVICLVPLLLVGAVLVVVLAVRFGRTAGEVREATATATATIARSGLGPDRRDVELRWHDATGTERTSVIHIPEISNVRTGAAVTLRYVPGDPTRVYVGGDESSVRLRNLAYGIVVVALTLLTAVVVTAIHVARRFVAERRPGTTMAATYARTRRGLVQRGWLMLNDQGREWWVPVHWETVLPALQAKTPCLVHGRPLHDRVLVVDVAGTQVWQSGRKRPVPPANALVAGRPQSAPAPQRAAAEALPIGLARQVRVDSALLVIAPLLGLLWSYVDRSGAGGFLAGTALIAAVLFWLPSVLGTDPA